MGRRAEERGQTCVAFAKDPHTTAWPCPGEPWAQTTAGCPPFLLLSQSLLLYTSPRRDLLLHLNFGKKRKSGCGQASQPTSFSSSCFSFTPKHICDKDICVMMHSIPHGS